MTSEESITIAKKQIEKEMVKHLTTIAVLFVSPWLISLVWNWQFAEMTKITLTYWQWFWLAFVCRNLTHDSSVK